ncbi:uncharacterized protein DDB_G0284459-like [Ptychodera flava]|uniref:uncharacterized protein DDB_G0284459-like n=1 Tax=Ptychodera flava TaxID=63121 RepID=UPI003969E4DF
MQTGSLHRRNSAFRHVMNISQSLTRNKRALVKISCAVFFIAIVKTRQPKVVFSYTDLLKSTSFVLHCSWQQHLKMDEWMLVYFAEDKTYCSLPRSDVVDGEFVEKSTISVKWRNFDVLTCATTEDIYTAQIVKIGTKKVVNRAELESSAKLREIEQNHRLNRPRERKSTAKKIALDEEAEADTSTTTKVIKNKGKAKKGTKENKAATRKKETLNRGPAKKSTTPKRKSTAESTTASKKQKKVTQPITADSQETTTSKKEKQLQKAARIEAAKSQATEFFAKKFPGNGKQHGTNKSEEKSSNTPTNDESSPVLSNSDHNAISKIDSNMNRTLTPLAKSTPLSHEPFPPVYAEQTSSMSQPAPPVQQPQMDNDTPSYTYLSNSWTSSVSESHDTSSFISKCTPSEDSSTSSQSANGPSMRQLLFDEELDESTSDIYRMAMNTVNEVDMVHAPAPFRQQVSTQFRASPKERITLL